MKEQIQRIIKDKTARIANNSITFLRSTNTMHMEHLRNQLIYNLQAEKIDKNTPTITVSWSGRNISLPKTENDELNHLLLQGNIKGHHDLSEEELFNAIDNMHYDSHGNVIKNLRARAVLAIVQKEIESDSFPFIEGEQDCDFTRYDLLAENIESIGLTLEHITKEHIGDGMCEGLTSAWIQAILSDDVTTFNQRMEILTRDPAQGWMFWGQHFNSLDDPVKEAREKSRNNRLPLDQQDPDTQTLLEIPAFLDTIWLYLSPLETPVIEDRGLPQDIIATSPFGLPKKLEHIDPDTHEVLPLTSPMNTSMSGNRNEITATLESFMQEMDEILPEDHPRIIKIDSPRHTIAVWFNDETLTIFDQNNLSEDNSTTIEFDRNDLTEAADFITRALKFDSTFKNDTCMLEAITNPLAEG
ncbi:hypothetical protein CI610_01623 [invertebrate metagenome]|uniref:Uncharacterized protein n=1 Tax=invertebrate metagenome TaxID=1711999 RepID=A0A2H9T835_9ZZZZ